MNIVNKILSRLIGYKFVRCADGIYRIRVSFDVGSASLYR
jgi:hypothetical protein